MGREWHGVGDDPDVGGRGLGSDVAGGTGTPRVGAESGDESGVATRTFLSLVPPPNHHPTQDRGFPGDLRGDLFSSPLARRGRNPRSSD